MLRIRLTRKGKKRQPTYRVVVADVDAPRDGRYVEQIGFYDPMVNPINYSLKESRALYWLSVGAQPSDAVRRLLDKQGTLERLKRHRAGESIEALAAEFDGVEIAEPAVEEVAGEAVEAVEEAAEDAVEEVAEVAEEAVEAVEDAADAVEEVAEEAAEVVADAADDADEA